MQYSSSKLILISLPPFRLTTPSASLTVLKQYMDMQGLKSNIKYFNIEYAQMNLLCKKNIGDEELLLPFLYLLNRKIFHVQDKADKVKLHMVHTFPYLFHTDISLADEIFDDIINRVENWILSKIDEVLQEKPFMVGFSSKFDQWIPAAVFSYYLKKESPSIPVVIGGWNNRMSAHNILVIIKYFDFSIWGEGEKPLSKLIKYLNQEISIEKVPRLVYWTDDKVKATKTHMQDSFIKLNEIAFWKFDDYMKYLSMLDNTDNAQFPLERSRGCNWNRCKFCSLNQGYCYQINNNESFVSYVRQTIMNNQVYEFYMVDNDFVGDSVQDFKELLYLLENIKKEYPKFSINMAEVITCKTDKETISLMARAGIKHVQIGLESMSESLLSQINKKQTVADNFFFMKNAIGQGITVGGANIITKTLNENDSSVFESIHALHYFRFVLGDSKLRINMTELGLSQNSIYLNMAKKNQEINFWNISPIASMLPDQLSSTEDRFSLFMYFDCRTENPLWNLFRKNLEFYQTNTFSYSFSLETEGYMYREYLNERLVKEILLEEHYIDIINSLQEKVYSLNE